MPGERALYKRAIGRTYAEWPLVEIVARAVVSGGSFQFVRIAAGGIAPVPLRLTSAEAAAQGAPATAATAAKAAEQAIVGAKPLPMTAYKLDLLKGLVQDLLERLAGLALVQASHDADQRERGEARDQRRHRCVAE